MVVLTEMISNWVTGSVVTNGCLMVVDSKSELCTRFTYVIALSVTTYIHVIKYTSDIIEYSSCSIYIYIHI